MATKRSVSPFGTSDTIIEDEFTSLEADFRRVFMEPAEKAPKELKTFEDARHLPSKIRSLANAPANDAPRLVEICQFVLNQRILLDDKQLLEPIYNAFLILFDKKTELFLIDHWTKEHCEKMGLPDDHRDVVLYFKERDELVGHFFAPFAEKEPGRFSAFVHRWIETENIDTLLHFFDFCKGAKSPTFEHYLLFTHPALSRLISNKNQLRSLLEKTKLVLSKLTSPTWEKDLRSALGL